MSEADLAVAVLRKAVLDARTGKRDARAFLSADDPDFQMWCELAELDPHYAAAQLRRALAADVRVARAAS